MPYTIVDRFERKCEACTRMRKMALVESDLGRREEVITLWCACPLSDLFEVIEQPTTGIPRLLELLDPKVDPEPS